MTATKPTHFAMPAEWRGWLQVKSEATLAKRLALLIDASAQGRRLATATQMEPK